MYEETQETHKLRIQNITRNSTHTIFSTKRDINYGVISSVQCLFMSFNKNFFGKGIKTPLKRRLDVKIKCF